MTMLARVERKFRALTRHLPPPPPRQDDRPHPRDLWLRRPGPSSSLRPASG